MRIELELIGRAGCHLCDEARTVVFEVARDYPEVHLTERSIDADATLQDRFQDEIPVVLLNGKQHAFWRVDPLRLRRALDKLRSDSSGE